MKNKKVLFTIITLLVVITVGFIATVFSLYVLKMKEYKQQIDFLNSQIVNIDVQDDNKLEQNQSSSQNTSIESLSDAELTQISSFLNQKGNNPFLQSNYSNPSEVDLSYIISSHKYVANDQEVERYEQLTKYEVTTQLYKATTEELKNELISKFGVQFVTNMNTEECKYLKEEDSYYTVCGDDLYVEIVCTSGAKKDNYYTVNFKSKQETGMQIEGTVILAGQDTNSLFFVSNQVREK